MNERLIPTTIVEAIGKSGALMVDSLYKRVKKFHGDPGSKFFNDTHTRVVEVYAHAEVIEVG